MKSCQQNSQQSIYEHGLAVSESLRNFLNYIFNNNSLPKWYRIPQWLDDNIDFIKSRLLSSDILLEYTLFHDCGKPYCFEIDKLGNFHFPNHAEISERIWLENGGDNQIGRLIGMDMLIHTIKDIDIKNFSKHKESISLLITGLAEIHANALMFGGIDSVSFKIKYKQIDRRGNALIKELNARY